MWQIHEAKCKFARASNSQTTFRFALKIALLSKTTLCSDPYLNIKTCI